MWVMQLWVNEKCPKFKQFVAITPSLILFLITNVFRKSYQLCLLTSILRSLHLALKIKYSTSSSWVEIYYFR